MTTLLDSAKFADVALGAYGTYQLGQSGQSFIDALVAAGLAQTQAATFETQWTVAAPSFSDPVSDFQATLFQEKLAGGAAGKFVLALRGTESTHDLFTTDAQITAQGVALDQVVALYNYVQQLQTAKTDTAAQYQLVIQNSALTPPANGIAAGVDSVTMVAAYLVPAPRMAGLGAIPPGTKIDIAGHSLGGHLAMAFDRLFPQLTDHVYTYNAPGFKDSSLVNDFFAALAGQTTTLDASKITNVAADQAGNGMPAWSAVAGLHSRPGTIAVDVPIENQLDTALVGDLVGKWNHSQLPLTDSLNLAAALAKLDASLSMTKFGQLFQANSNTVSTSLERTLDGMRRLFGLPATTATGNRTDFYNNLKQFSDVSVSLAGKVTLGLAIDASLATNARTDFAAALALTGLSPIALTANGPDGRAALDALWQTPAWNSTYQNWLSDYAARQSGGVAVNFTDTYLNDRQDLLQYVITANLKDAVANPDGYLAVQGTTNANINTRFIDLTSGTMLQVNRALISPSTAPNQYIIFGNSAANTINGSTQEDRLYGMAGDDTLDGLAGNDYIEGGVGTDTYEFSGSFGNDTVLDSDGLGAIKIGNIVLTGGKWVKDGVWVSDDKAYLFMQRGADLIISLRAAGTATSGTITVRNWQAGQLGLTLPGLVEAPKPEPATSFDFASLSGINAFVAADANHSTQDLEVNGVATAYNVGTTSEPLWRSHSVTTGSGSDIIEGGVIPAVSNIVMSGGAGDDFIFATTYTTLQDAIDRGDNSSTVAISSSHYVLDGGIGDDQIVGSDARDVIFGGAGDDVIVGGAGGDIIFGDGNAGDLLLGVHASLTDALIVDGAVTGIGNNAMLRIDHAGIDLGLTGSNTVGARRRVQADPATQYINPMYAADYTALQALNDTDVRGLGYSVDPFNWAGVSYGDLTPDQMLGQHTTYTGDGAALSTNKETGDDFIYAGAGDDSVNAGAGDDFVFAGDGNDVVAGYEGDDYIRGDAGNDLLLGDAWAGGMGPIAADTESIDFYSANLHYTYALGASRHGVDTIDGGAGEDWVEGGGKSDLLYGGEGNDTMFGDDHGGRVKGALAGDDLMFGDAGDDFIFGGAGKDQIHGGDGNDTLVGDWQQDDGNGGASDILFGDAGDDNLFGGAGGDFLYGGTGNDVLRGDATAVAEDEGFTIVSDGNEEDIPQSSAAANDLLDGGDGNDALFGGDGDDVLIGGAGDDFLRGGAGNNTYVFDRGDGQDVIGAVEGTNSGSFNVLQFGAGIKLGDVEAIRRGQDLILHLRDTSDAIIIASYYLGADPGNPKNPVQKIAFSDGSSWLGSQVPSTNQRIAFDDSARSFTYVYDYTGKLQSNTWTKADGSRGAEQYEYRQWNTPGAVPFVWGIAGLAYNADGSTTNYSTTIDSSFERFQGTTTNQDGSSIKFLQSSVSLNRWGNSFWYYNATGALTSATSETGREDGAHVQNLFDDLQRLRSDTWVKDDGSYGSDTFSLEGNGSGIAKYSDGSYSTYTETVISDASSTSTRRTSNFNALGLVTGTVVAQRGPYSGDFSTSYYDSTGLLFKTSWGKSEAGGSTGTTLFNADGSSAGTIVRTDGSYCTNVNDGHGNVRAENFNASGVLLGSSISQSATSGNIVPMGLVGMRIGSTAVTATTSLKQGNVLSAANTVSDTDGLGVFGYQWFANGIAIVGATGTSLTLTQAQVGKTVSVEARYTDNLGTFERVLSAPTSAVININDVPTGTVVIIGSATQSQTLTASNTLADADGLGTIAYQWRADGVTIAGATGDTLVLGALQVGKAISVVASYTDAQGTIESKASTATPAVIGSFVGTVGADTLNGTTGVDQLVGLAGDDIYVVNNTGDIVVENLNEGIDTVQSSVTHALAANVENLTLTGTTAINATGNALDNVLTGNSGINVLTGGAGNDTYVVGTGDTTIEAASAGTDTVQSVIAWTLATNVENLTLTGTAAINGTGNALDNVLTGNAGTNVLTGGAGNDTYVVGTGDSTVEVVGGGVDTAQSGVTWTLGTEVENLTLTGTTAINGTGNTLNNVLTGNSAANTLSGGTGADTMLGGLGNDTYVVDNAADVVTENLSEGTDLVQSSVSYTLAANVENLTLTGTAVINGTGNALNNTVTGNSGNNILDGGAGADTMAGGAGNDTYFADNAADVTTEAASAGTDTVISSINWTLATNLENLTLSGAANINATGNAVANVLTGNAGDNVLNGGAGADTMIGGFGNDTYVVDVATDVVTELASAGTDTVQSSVTLTLGANVENLTLTATTAINGTGNALDNVLTGGSGVNVLTGGAGNDTYVVGTGDTTIETASAGTDTVQSAIAWTLATNVENLTLTGTSAVNGVGNTLDNILLGNNGVNTLTGNAGNDILNGGAGADILVGGTGNDTYWLGRGYGVDSITENDTTAGNTDVARFDIGIATDQLWFSKTGNNLDVSIIGTADKFTMTNWYLGSQYHTEQFKTSDGKTLLDSQVQNLVSAMAAFSPPAAGQTTLPANYASSLAPVIAANWQ